MKKLKKAWYLLLLPTLILTFIAIKNQTKPEIQPKYKYIGSTSSNKYHYPKCKWAKKISDKKIIRFQDISHAMIKGYEPCKICKPPSK